MIPALAVFCSAIALAWVLPLPLGRLSRDGVSPRLGLAAWLTAITSVLALVLAALGLLARSAVSGWPTFARTVCESVTSGVCPPAVYRSAAYELGLAAVAFVGGITLIVLGWRYGRSLRRTSVSTREHAEAARIVGHRVGGHRVGGYRAGGHLAGGGDAAFVLDTTRPAVYCVPGRPPTIVVTTGALAVLEPGQLTAVLAHERAHLAGRHHLLLALTRSLAAVTPFVPLFARGAVEVARLAEMRADDAAARHGGAQGRRTLLTALLAMAAGGTAAPVPASPALATPALATSVPASWLPATGGVVATRVRRLAEPPAPARRARYRLTLAALTLAIAAAAVLVPALAATGI
jgi:Zn-dependent protease with chaperone function